MTDDRFNSNKIRLVFAEDHPLIREGLKSSLERCSPGRFEVVGEATTGYEALELCRSKKPDVLVLDWHLPGDLDGYGVLRSLHEFALPVKVLLLTGDARYVDNFRWPIVPDDYLLKGATISVVVEKLEKLARALKFNSPSLTTRESEILECIGRGMTNKAIGVELHISEGTVATHLTNIFRKLEAENRAEALQIAISKGLFSGTAKNLDI